VAVNDCLRVISGCIRTTSVQALHVEVGCVPQEWRARLLLLRLAVRCIGRGREDLVGKILLDYCNLGPRARSVLGSGGYASQMLLDGEFSRFRLVTVVPPMGPWIWASKLSGCVVVSSVEDLGLEVFCDASFSSDSLEGGVGVFVPSLKWQRAWKLAVVPSVFVAEMAAISQALLVGLESGAVRFTVLSDSLSAVRALQGHIQSLNFRHPTILEVGLRLFEAMQTGVRARVVWVRGHAGILGNEEADALSRAARCGEGGTLMHLAVSVGDLRPVVGDVVRTGWEEEWVSSPKGRCLYSLHPSTSSHVG